MLLTEQILNPWRLSVFFFFLVGEVGGALKGKVISQASLVLSVYPYLFIIINLQKWQSNKKNKMKMVKQTWRRYTSSTMSSFG